MIGPTSSDLIKHILANPKDAKAIAKVMLEAPTATKSSTQTPLAQTLLAALSKGETTPASVRQTLESTPWVKNAPALVQDIKNLANTLKQDPALKAFAQPFKKILNASLPNNPATPQALQARLQNSGLHYEATLKQSIPANTITPAGRSLIETLLQLLPKAPLSPPLKAPLQALAKDLLQVPTPQKAQQFLQTLNSTLQHAQTHLSKNHPLLPLSKNIEQLQQLLNTSNTKNAPLPTGSNTPAQTTQANQQNTIQQHAKEILVKFEAATPTLRASNIPAQTIQSIKNALLQIAQSPASPQPKAQYNTQNIPLHVNQTKPNTPNTPTQPTINSQNRPSQQPVAQNNLNFKPTPPAIQQSTNLLAPHAKPTLIVQDAKIAKTSQPLMPMFAIISQLQTQPPALGNGDLQTRLAQAISRLQSIIQQADATAAKLPQALSKLENLQSQIRFQLTPLSTPPPNIQESTINDVKRLLLEVQQNTNGKEAPLAKEVNSLANKALGQLDFHQLYSLVSQQTHTYLPYLWEGLQGGALQYKRDSERTYCKIDLEFEQFNRVQILIALFDQHHIALTVGVEHPELFSRISNHLKELRSMLISAGLVPQSVTLLPTLHEMPYESFAKEEVFGFDFKV
jgi:hypothetical protein